MATPKLNAAFQGHIFEDTKLLDIAIAWINEHMTIDQIFTEEDIKNFLSDEMPEKYYSKDDLEAWAIDNGFVKPE